MRGLLVGVAPLELRRASDAIWGAFGVEMS